MAKIAEILNNVVSDSGVEISSLQPLLTNPVTGTGTTNYIPKFTSSSAIGNSVLYESGGTIGINATSFISGSVLDVRGGTIVSTNSDLDRITINPASRSTSPAFGMANGSMAIYTVGAGVATPFGIGTFGGAPLIFGTANTERMRLDASGNLGLGTSSPSAKFESVQASNGVGGWFVGGQFSAANYPLIRFAATTPNKYSSIGNNGDGSLYFIVNGTSSTIGTEALRLDASGNLGLGVTPSAWRSSERALQIGATTSLYNVFGITLLGNNYFTNSSNQSIYINSAFATYYWQSSNDGSHQWSIAPSGTAGNVISWTQAMTLFSTGNLAVGGTSDNGFRLDVTGNVQSQNTSALFVANSSSSSYYGGLSIRQSGTEKVRFAANSTEGAYIYSPTAQWNGFSILNDASIFFRITSSGNVGIGTTSPGYKTEIRTDNQNATQTLLALTNSYGGATDGARLLFQVANTGGNGAAITGKRDGGTFGIDLLFETSSGVGSAATEKMRITSGGYVGIGTTSPIQPLTVAALSNANTISLLGRSSDNAQRIDFYNNAGNSRLYTIGVGNGAVEHYSEINAPMVFSTNASERMRITSAGNVGIGTSSPQSGLQIEKYGSKFDSDQQYTQPSGNIFMSMPISVANQDYWFGIKGNYGSSSGSANLLLQANVRDIGSQAGHYVSSKATALGNSDFEIGKLVTSTSVSTPASKVPQFYISGAGNVGIGTTSPTQKLHIEGTGTTYALIKGGGNNTVGLLTQNGNKQYFTGTYYNVSDAWEVADLTAGGLTRLVISSTGNVGIGTTSPAYKLDVNGISSAALGFLINSGGYNSIANVPYTGMFTTEAASAEGFGALLITSRTDTARPIIFGTSGGSTSTERMRIAAAGNVGIGTTSPSAKLHVSANSPVSTDIGFTGGIALGTEYSSLRFRADSYNWTSAEIRGVATNGGVNLGVLQFFTSDAERMRITSGGSVGIGTSNPLTPLHIQNGNSTYTNPDNTNVPNVYINNTQGSSVNAHSILTLRTFGASSGNPFISFDITGVTGYAMGVDNGDSDKFKLSNNWGNVSSNTLLTITTGGNMGIGTTSPNTKLQVTSNSSAGTVAGSASIVLSNRDNTNSTFVAGGIFADMYRDVSNPAYGAGIWFERVPVISNASSDANIIFGSQLNPTSGLPTERMRIAAGGNVGIGTTAPSEKLDISGSSNIYAKITSTSTGANAGIKLNSSGAREFGIFSDGDLRFYDFTAATERMRITSGGNVGIGTTSPQQKLHIAGDVQIGESSGGEKLRFVGASNKYNFQLGKQINVDNGFEITPSTAAGGTTFSTPAFVVTSGGNVGIGSTNPSYKLEVIGTSYFDSNMLIGNGSELRMAVTGINIKPALVGGTWKDMVFTTASAEAMRITGNGEVCIGQTTAYGAGWLMNVNGNAYVAYEVYAGTGIQTGAPTGGTSKKWKLGKAGVTLGGSNYSGVEVEIDGTLYYLVTGYLP